MEDKKFSNNWFNVARGTWDALFPQLKPKRILEIGSFEGQATCYAIESGFCEEITCVDTWEGGIEHSKINMRSVEESFDHNTSLANASLDAAVNVIKRKGYSDFQLASLLAEGKQGYYDFVYVDGSHQAPDVIVDAVMAFKLCRKGGVIGFDDYCWAENLNYGVDPIRCPKPAIDAFTTLFCRKVKIVTGIPMYQLYVNKLSD